MAARIRRELQTDVEMVSGPYGTFKVVIDDDPVIDVARDGILGMPPSRGKIMAAVRAKLSVPA